MTRFFSLLFSFFIFSTPSLLNAQDITDTLSWKEPGKQTIISNSCAAFRLHGVVAEYEQREFSFFEESYQSCAWLAALPELKSIENNPTMETIITDINRLGGVFMEKAKAKEWLTNTGGYLIAKHLKAEDGLLIIAAVREQQRQAQSSLPETTTQ